MPTYTYKCTKCGDETEAVQSMSDPPLKRCKKCRGALRRTFNPVGIVLKGSGFHRNDYRSPSRKSGESADKKSESTSSEGSSDKGSTDKKSDSGTESKSESKSDTKTEAKPSTSKASKD